MECLVNGQIYDICNNIDGNQQLPLNSVLAFGFECVTFITMPVQMTAMSKVTSERLQS